MEDEAMQEQIRHGDAHGQDNPRQRLDRMLELTARGLAYWKGGLIVFLATAAIALAVAFSLSRVYRSECTIFAKPHIRTDDRDDGATSPDQVARQAARLKDMLTTRGRLESAIRQFDLYHDTIASKTMLDGVEQMKPHVGFRSIEGAQYVISFDGDDPDAVQKVTQYLSDSLISDYASNDSEDLRREADFLAREEERTLGGLEDATRGLTVFLAAHPEFAAEAKQAAMTPFGPSPTAGIPLMPKVSSVEPIVSDPELAALYRERSRLDADARGSSAVAHGILPMAPGSIDEQIAQAQGQAEAAAKRVAETQADLASKSNLTENPPDVRASRMAADAAARQLREAKVVLASLQQAKATGAAAAASGRAAVSSQTAEKLRQLAAHIAARRAQLAKPSDRGGATAEATSARASAVSAVVELETDWQRLLRALNEAKARHDDLKLRAERAKLAFGAAQAQANESMSIIDPPFRPTHPSKGGRTNVALAGLAMALLMAIGYATARVALSDTLVDSHDIEALGLLRVLGVIPQLEFFWPKAERGGS